jgi:hypothetical protein
VTLSLVKGFEQKKGVYFNEIFSPVVKMPSIRVILGLAARYFNGCTKHFKVFGTHHIFNHRYNGMKHVQFNDQTRIGN